MLQCYKVSRLPFNNVIMLQGNNVTMLQCYNVTLLHCYNVWTGSADDDGGGGSVLHLLAALPPLLHARAALPCQRVQVHQRTLHRKFITDSIITKAYSTKQ